MLDYKKIGKFLQELRSEKGYSQEKVAELLYVTRQVISKWERGGSLPNYEMLLSLCELYKISPNEILAGERSSKENKEQIQNMALEVLKDGQIRLKKKTILYIGIIIILILTFFVYYFLSTYNQIRIYNVGGNNENFSINNGIILKNNEQIYFNLGNISIYNNKQIEQIYIYYLKNDEKNLIYQANNTTVSLYDKKGYNQYFNFDDWNDIISNLFIDITYNEYSTTETIKLDTFKMYTNNNLFFKESSPMTYESKSEKNEFDKIRIPSKIKKEFRYNEKDKTFELKKENDKFKAIITYDPNANSLSVVEKYKNNISKLWTYIPSENEDSFLDYHYYKNEERIINSTFIGKETSCNMGDCKNVQEEFNYFMKNYLIYFSE